MPLLDDVDVHYSRGTKPQGPLPFHIRIRRRHAWWPGPERYGRLIDRSILTLVVLTLMSPGIVWAVVSFGWMPLIVLVIEIVVIRFTVYKVLTGTILEWP
jgi:hypothetical protein